MLTRWRQIWCVCSVKLCDPCLSTSEVSFSQWGAIQIYLPFFFFFNHQVCVCIYTGKLSGDSVSNHQVSRVATSPNGNIFTSQFSANSAGTPLRGTINIKLSSQSAAAAALRGTNTASSLADADSEETNSGPRRTTLLTSADSSSSPPQVTNTGVMHFTVIDLHTEGRWAVSVRASVCPCLDLTWEWKGLGSPKFVGWKPITRVTREPV